MARAGLKLLAFLVRIIGRVQGRRLAPLPERAARYANRLAQAVPGSAAMGMDLLAIQREPDLLYEESALIPEVLRLQARLVELAPGDPLAASLVNLALESPVWKLTSAILSHAGYSGCHAIRIVVPAAGPLRALDPRGAEIMTIPKSLERALHGALRLVAEVGLNALRPYLARVESLPEAVQITESPNEITALFSNDRAPQFEN